MDKKIIKGFAVVIIAAILISIPLGMIMYKQYFQNATYQEIIEIYGIGDILTVRIIEYVESHPECDIDDLINVKGIGELKLEMLKEEFR